MKLKLLPKIIIVAAVVGGVGYAVNLFLNSQPQATVQAQQQTVTTVQAQAQPVQQIQAPAQEVKAEPVAAAPVPAPAQPAQTSNASENRGLNALLNHKD